MESIKCEGFFHRKDAQNYLANYVIPDNCEELYRDVYNRKELYYVDTAVFEIYQKSFPEERITLKKLKAEVFSQFNVPTT